MLQKRAEGIPLQYILQYVEFCSLRLKVIPGVFIPRPETELLVEEVLHYIDKRSNFSYPINILDLGTGTGAVLLSLLKEIKDAYGIGIDKNSLALSLAKENAFLNNIDNATFLEGDIFFPEKFVFSEKFDIITSNPPYIPNNEIKNLQREVRYEPLLALNGGEDGLLYYPYIFKWGKMFLKKYGIIAIEMGIFEWKDIKEIASSYGFSGYFKKDFNNVERIGIFYENYRT